jgi:hypothetical protein
MTLTRWPVIWNRRIISSQEIARANALAASRTLTQRRLEREDTERLLADG